MEVPDVTSSSQREEESTMRYVAATLIVAHDFHRADPWLCRIALLVPCISGILHVTDADRIDQFHELGLEAGRMSA